MAGRNVAGSLQGVDTSGVVTLGVVDDLGPLFDGARVFIAPTRCAAGIGQGADGGRRRCAGCDHLLIAEQLGWRNGVDILVGDDASAFADQCVKLYQDEGLWNALRETARQRVADECAPARFRANLQRALLLAQASRFGEATTSVDLNQESGSN